VREREFDKMLRGQKLMGSEPARSPTKGGNTKNISSAQRDVSDFCIGGEI